jgi:hypothetical protein
MDVHKTRSKHNANHHIEQDNHATPVQDAHKDYGLPSLDLAFDLVKERMSGQLARIDGLDNKANFIMGTATGIVGLALTLQATLFSAPATSYCTAYIPTFLHTLNPLLKRAIPLVPLIVTYVIVMYLSHRAYKIDHYYEVPSDPEGLYDYLTEDVAITKIDIYRMIKVNFQQNEEKIRSKARKANYALQCLELEGIVLVVFLLYRSVC